MARNAIRQSNNRPLDIVAIYSCVVGFYHWRLSFWRAESRGLHHWGNVGAPRKQQTSISVHVERVFSKSCSPHPTLLSFFLTTCMRWCHSLNSMTTHNPLSAWPTILTRLVPPMLNASVFSPSIAKLGRAESEVVIKNILRGWSRISIVRRHIESEV